MPPVVHIPRVTKREALCIGDALGVDFSVVDLKEFTEGVNVELEHIATIQALFPNADRATILKGAAMIALDHLTEINDYYVRLLRMESEAKR